MKSRVMCELLTINKEDGDLVSGNLRVGLAGRDIFEELSAVVQGETNWSILYDVRFNKESDGILWRDFIQTNLTDVRVKRGSRFHIHNCPHGNPRQPQYHCREDIRANYQEIVKA